MVARPNSSMRNRRIRPILRSCYTLLHIMSPLLRGKLRKKRAGSRLRRTWKYVNRPCMAKVSEMAASAEPAEPHLNCSFESCAASEGSSSTGSTSWDGTQEGSLSCHQFIQSILEESQGVFSPNGNLFQLLGDRPPPRAPILDSFDLAGIAQYIRSKPNCKILVLTGAGISVAAGIPDFRSPTTGLYSRLQQYNLPFPSAVFDLEYFPSRPEPFYTVAKELWPGNYAPTLVHLFITMLYEKGLLLRAYTQNIDGLDLVAGLPPEALVEVHGTFASARCLGCRQPHDSAAVREAVFTNCIPRCECGGLVKPDIVFFGEQLPERFFRLVRQDLEDAELVIVIGTSLQVAPVASLPDMCADDIPRLLINNEIVGEHTPFRPHGFDFSESNYRDVKCIGDCQQIALQLADLLGWKQELLDRHESRQPGDQFSFGKSTWLEKEDDGGGLLPHLSVTPEGNHESL